MDRRFLFPLASLVGVFVYTQAHADIPPTAPMPAPSAPKSYTLDPAASSLYVQVFKDPSTIAAGLSHDHVIVATGWTGSVTWNAADASACKVSIQVPVSGLVNDEPGMRTKVGYTTTLDDGQRTEVKEHMLSDTQLNMASFAAIKFDATACSGGGDSVQVTGNLSLHGVSKSITVPMKITATDTSFSAAGLLTIKGSDFGITPFSALGGALKNKDEMKFVVKVKSK